MSLFADKFFDKLPALKALERISNPGAETLRACVLELARVVIRLQNEQPVPQPQDADSVADLTAAYRYAECKMSHNDSTLHSGLSWSDWGGWALRDAFLAGAAYARGRQDATSTTAASDQQNAPPPGARDYRKQVCRCCGVTVADNKAKYCEKAPQGDPQGKNPHRWEYPAGT